MDYQITLRASSKDKLNILIDEKLKEGYLLQGGMCQVNTDELEQSMVLPENIDGEVSSKSILYLVIYLIVLFATLNYLDIF